MPGTIAWLLVLGLAGLQSAAAQAPGDRIRIRLGSPVDSRLTGVYQGIQDTLLLLSGEPRPHAIPLSNIVSMEQSAGRKPSVAGGVLGLLLGAGAGLALGCLANQDDYGVYCGGQDDTKVIVGMTLGGILGAAAGALLFKQEQWTPLAVPAQRLP